MGDVLSHSEVAAILSAVDFSSLDAASSANASPTNPTAHVQTYDFEHPVPLHPVQLEALRLSVRASSPSLQNGLGLLLRTTVAVHFLEVEQSTYRDYLATSENPSCLAILESRISSDPWLLDMSRSLALTFIDCLLGGSPAAAVQSADRSFTSVEARLIEKAFARILQDLSSDVLQTNSLRMTRLVSDGSLIAKAVSNEAVALVSFEITCGPCRGLFQLCVPWKEIADSPLRASAAGQSSISARLAATRVPVTATARIANLKLTARELATLSPGDVLLTDTDSSAEIGLEVDGREIFRGTAGRNHDRKVMLLTVPVHAEDRT